MAVAWDAPVQRIEAGLGFSPRRHVLLKAVYQDNRRYDGRHRPLGVAAGQVLLWY
jgi:hypothetical protein